VSVRAVLVVVGLLPFLPALLGGLPGLAVLGRWIDGWLEFQCGRDPERMLGVGAACARCLGIYGGLGLGALLLYPRVPAATLFRFVLAGLVLIALDVGSEALLDRPAWAPLRVATGLAFAYPAGVLAVLTFGSRTKSRPGVLGG
jgi:uncharacterized membrane protein